MAGLNKVTLIGYLGKDPEIRYSQGGNPVATFSLATSESWKDKQGQPQEHTEWHRIVLFKRQAEIAAEYLQKGSMIYLEGKLRTRKWQDQGGQDRWTTEIIGSQMQMQMLTGNGKSPEQPSDVPDAPENDDDGDDLPF